MEDAKERHNHKWSEVGDGVVPWGVCGSGRYTVNGIFAVQLFTKNSTWSCLLTKYLLKEPYKKWPVVNFNAEGEEEKKPQNSEKFL